AFGNTGLALELNLLLSAGRIQEVLSWSEDVKEEQVKGINPITFYWLRALGHAGAGQYARADSDLAAQLGFSLAGRQQTTPLDQDEMSKVVAQALLDSTPGQRLPWSLIGTPGQGLRVVSVPASLHTQLLPLADELRRLADVHTLIGLLALEAGQ